MDKVTKEGLQVAFDEGQTDRQIAFFYGRSITGIRYWYVKLGVKRVPVGTPTKKLEELIELGYSLHDIGTLCGVSRQRVYQLLTKRGLLDKWHEARLAARSHKKIDTIRLCRECATVIAKKYKRFCSDECLRVHGNRRQNVVHKDRYHSDPEYKARVRGYNAKYYAKIRALQQPKQSSS